MNALSRTPGTVEGPMFSKGYSGCNVVELIGLLVCKERECLLFRFIIIITVIDFIPW